MINNDKKPCKLLINKAFTLIELLAVIVILAIIAVIATPIILGVIDDSKLKAKENSVNGLMEAVNMTYTKSQLSAIPLKLPITATINNGVITATDGTNSVEVTYTGERPISGTIKIDEFGGLSASNIKYSDNYICTKENGENGCINHILTLPGMVEDVMTIGGETVHTGRYIFRGETPNNCIYLKEEGDIEASCNYRIVSIESDGTIKVIRNAAVTSMSYDSRSGAGTAESPYIGPRRNEVNSYCNYAKSYNNYNGCNAWNKVNGTYNNNGLTGTVSDDSELNIYLNTAYYNLLDENVRKKIVTHSFNTTPNSHGVGVSSLTSLYNATMTWTGKIGLLELRDWFNATSNGSCNSALAGSGWNKIGTASPYPCAADNYLYNSAPSWWLMSPGASSRYFVFYVSSAGYIDYNYAYCKLGVRPVFYLSSNIALTESGTSGDPYKIK